MMNEEIIYELLSTGMYKDKEINIHEINSLLRPLHFEVVPWLDNSCYILVNLSDKDVIVEYTEEENNEIKRIFECITHNKEVKSNLLESLVENEWIEKSPIRLSKKTLVLYKDYILSLNGRYRECEICQYLVEDKSIHDYCNRRLDQE